MRSSVLLIQCPDRPGIIASVSKTLKEGKHNIETLWQYADPQRKLFFMRVEFSGTPKAGFAKEVKKNLSPDATVKLTKRGKKRIVILATKEPHCLGDLLVKANYGDLNCEIAAVISNHTVLEHLSERFSIPFHFVPHEGLSREQHEKNILSCINQYSPDFIVLAKYMRVLTDSFVSHFETRIINIHHSFLPAFAGAKPYNQAYDRGVKLIGATAHFVNEHLDDGPIILQNVIRTDHSQSSEDMACSGRNVEQTTLTQALKLVLQERVFVNGRKTVVFE